MMVNSVVSDGWGNINVNFNGCCFKFVDVPTDGDCFYHSLLRSPILNGKFQSVYHLRSFIQQSVMKSIGADSILQKLFIHYRTNCGLWGNRIIKMHKWAQPLDMIVCAYILNVNIVSIGNYINGMMENNIWSSLNMIMRYHQVPNIMNLTIHIYCHNAGFPFQKIWQGNHFAYLEPIVMNPILRNTTMAPVVTPYKSNRPYSQLIYGPSKPHIHCSGINSHSLQSDDDTPSLCSSVDANSNTNSDTVDAKKKICSNKAEMGKMTSLDTKAQKMVLLLCHLVPDVPRGKDSTGQRNKRMSYTGAIVLQKRT